MTHDNQFFITGIGASAGGLEALEKFFGCMPAVSNMAFIVIQHLSPDFKSLMPEILSRAAHMNVYQIQNGMEIKAGCIYLNPPKYSVAVSHGKLHINEQDPRYKVNCSINSFLESLAEDMKDRAIAIILSGTGSDGTRGCQAIKEAGGVVVSQDTQSAKFYGMPKSVISANICDFILPPEKIPEILIKYTQQPSLIPVMASEDQKYDETADKLTLVYDMLKKGYFIDFSQYKQSTILRCLDRRIRICQLQSLEEYVTYLENNVEELDCLYNSLLIGVTRFFRDAAAYEAVKSKIIPEIVDRRSENSIIRVWVVGCSTGEEAYSLAILFKEYMDVSRKNLTVKIFATDIDNKSLEYASSGVYPESIANDISLERLNRFFIKKQDGYHIVKHLREMVIFSHHNIISNPPFYKIDFLSCRNLLIYFQPELQKRILSTFQFALKANGFLLLGSSETTGELSSYFSILDSKWKLFERKDMKKRPLVDDFSAISTSVRTLHLESSENHYSLTERNSFEMEDLYLKIMEECLPPSVLVNEDGELIQVYSDIDKYLKMPRGKVNLDIRKMIPRELSTAVGTAINKVIKEKKSVTYTNIKVQLNHEQTIIDLIVKPLFTKKSGLLILVTFNEVKNKNKQSAEYAENFDTISKLHERISDLEQELQYTKESLQTSIEEVETSSEELQSANEELLVSNEELHSTNEELQSVNEELLVVNTQYQYKIQELADLNNDMTNFLNSTSIGTIFLDSNLCVRKFTPAVTKEINLIEQDIGRPIGHISHNLIDLDLISDSREVMDNLIPVEKEVRSSGNKWYMLKYSPFRTNENTIKGVVLSLVDITRLKAAEESQRRSNEKLDEAIALDTLKSDFFSNLSHELRTPLNVIMSTLQLLEALNKKGDDKLTNKQRKYFNIMKQNCYRQLRLVNNMIDSSKIDAGFFKLNLQNYNIVRIIENITLSVSEYIKNKGIELIFDTDTEEKIMACDLDGVERIILNLLSNAVKFTKSGGKISVSLYDKGDKLTISVKDTGVGIPPDKQGIIFDRFRQVDKSLARDHEGSGIGLSLVKSIIDMHGGNISVRSEPGKGTEFLVDMPVRIIPESEAVKRVVHIHQNNVEKIHVEFADIYNF